MSEKENQLETLVFQGMVERIEMLGRIQALEKLVFDLHPATEEQLHAHMRDSMTEFVDRILVEWEDIHPALAARLQSMRAPSEGTS
jgi:hypothetical protein